MNRMHLDATPEGSVIALSICGRLGSFETTTNVQALVTCKDCRRKLATTPTLPPPAPRLELVPTPETGPAEPPGYVVTPERYDQRNCRCGRCDTCVWYKPFEAIAEGNDAPLRGPSEAEGSDHPRWSTVKAALAWYQAHLTKAHGLDSLLGHYARHEDEPPVVFVQQSPRGSSKTSVDAEDGAIMHAVLTTAYARSSPEPFAFQGWLTVLMARVVGGWSIGKTRRGRPAATARLVPIETVALCFGLPETTVRSVERRGMRAVRVELGARGLVAASWSDREITAEIEMRRGELARRRTG